MKNLIIIGIILAITLSPIVSASAEETITLINEEEVYTGLIAPDSPLYPIKIGFENFDELLTFNETQKLEKKMEHAKLRIREANTMMLKNKLMEAEQTLARYNQKISEITLTNISILMIQKHQAILYNLTISHPNSTGLQKAYNNSKILILKHEVH